MNVPDLLKSKKFWVAIIASLVIGLNDGLELGLAPESVQMITGVLVALMLTFFGVDWKYTAQTGELNPKYQPSVKPDVIESIHEIKRGA